MWKIQGRQHDKETPDLLTEISSTEQACSATAQNDMRTLTQKTVLGPSVLSKSLEKDSDLNATTDTPDKSLCCFHTGLEVPGLSHSLAHFFSFYLEGAYSPWEGAQLQPVYDNAILHTFYKLYMFITYHTQSWVHIIPKLNLTI